MRLLLVQIFTVILLADALERKLKELTISKGREIQRTSGCRGSTCPFDVSDLTGSLGDIDVVNLEVKPGVSRRFVRDMKRATGYLFHGEGAEGVESMNLLTRELETEGDGPNATLFFGSASDNETLFQIAPDEFGVTQITETLWSDYPEEESLFPPTDRMLISEQMEVDIPVKRKISSAVRSLPRFQVGLNGKRRNLVDDQGGNIDVMVVWTHDAECDRAGKPVNCQVSTNTTDTMMGVVELAVEETNVAFEESGIHTQLRLVHAYRDDSYAEPSVNTVRTALNDITFLGDRKLDDVHAKRDEYGADVVALIVAGRADVNSCGIAWVGPNINYMFSVTRWKCATGYFSFGHEIGHNMGAEHDRGASGQRGCSKPGFNHAWRDPQARFRTILAYDCISGQCDNNAGNGCPRIQRFSNQNILYNYTGAVNAPLGDARNDNALQLNSVLAEVAGYRQAVVEAGISPVEGTENSTSQVGDMQTLMTTNVGGSSGSGNMFKINVTKSIDVVGLDVYILSTSDVRVLVYTRQGSYENATSDESKWTRVQDVNVTGLGQYSLTPLPPFDVPVRVTENSSQAFYVTLVGNDMLGYTTGSTEGALFASDGTVNLYEGQSFDLFFSGSSAPVIWNGIVNYFHLETVVNPSPPESPSPTTSPNAGPPPKAFHEFVTTLGGGDAHNGVMFKINVTENVEILGFDIYTSDTSQVRVMIYTMPGEYVTQKSPWIKVQDVYVRGLGDRRLTALPLLENPVGVPATRTQSFYVTMERHRRMKYSRGSHEGAIYKSNGIVHFYEGIGLGYPFRGRPISPRIYNGNMKFKVLDDSTSAPAAAPCVDRQDWTFLTPGGVIQNCDWVGKDPSTRCEKVGRDRTSGFEACKVACGLCQS